MHGEGAHAHLDVVQCFEMRHEVVCDDADEARGQATLRHEGMRRAFGHRPDLIGDLDVLRQIEIVAAVLQGQRGNGRIAKVGQARDDRIDRMRAQIGCDCFPFPHVEHGRCDAGKPKVFHQMLRGVERHIPQMDVVAALLGEQAGDQRADLSCAEHEHPRHRTHLRVSSVYSSPGIWTRLRQILAA